MWQRFFTILTLSILVSGSAIAQEFSVSLGAREQGSISSDVKVGDAIMYEANLDKTYFPLGLHMRLQLNERISYSPGLRYFDAGTSFVVYDDTVCNICPVEKVGVIGHPTIELPQEIGFTLYSFRKFQLDLMGAVTPAIRLGKSSYEYDGPVRPLSWSEDAIEVFNALPSTVKMAFVNYSFGLRIAYSRFAISAYWQQNLTRNMANPLEVNGREYIFGQRVASLNLNLTYTFLRLDKDKEPEK